MRSLILQPLKGNPARAQTARLVSMPPPVGGWNARDSLAEMPATDAPVLDDWWPTASDVVLRNGFDDHVTGIGQQVESLLAYNSPTAEELYGVAGGSIFDVTTAGAVGAAKVSSLTNSRWQYINVANTGGNFLMAVNGADKLQGYDGTNWYVDGDTAHDITGVDTADWIQIHLFKRRVWGVEKDTLKVWYLGTDAISGAASAIDFGPVAKQGGYLVTMDSWTVDAGEGQDDYAVFVTSEGESIIYKGTDPSDASKWALQGVYHTGEPIGRRCTMKYGGDCLVLTVAGAVPLSKVLASGEVRKDIAITDKIGPALADVTARYNANFGWEMCLFPKASMLIVNVPVQAGSAQIQYVMNTTTGAWARFTKWKANCFAVHKKKLYFGGNGTVYEAWEDQDDNGANISAFAVQAFSDLGLKGGKLQVTQARPVLACGGNPATRFGVNFDYDTADHTGVLSFSATAYGIWGTSKWGVGLWGSSTVTSVEWQGVNGLGIAVSPTLKVSAKSMQVRWRATNLLVKRGSAI